MNLSLFFKSVVDADSDPVVICNLNHEIIYMNPTAVKRYAKRGGGELVGKSLLNCHNAESNRKISDTIEWFKKNPENNRVFTLHKADENKDVYIIALRDESGELIGYYEKHERRMPDTGNIYDFK